MWKQYKAGFWFELLVDFDTLGRRQTLDSPRSWRCKWNGMSFHRVSHSSSMKVERKKEKLRHTRLKNITHNSLLPFTSLDKSVQDDDMNHSDLTVCHLVGQIFGFLFFCLHKNDQIKMLFHDGWLIYSSSSSDRATGWLSSMLTVQLDFGVNMMCQAGPDRTPPPTLRIIRHVIQ